MGERFINRVLLIVSLLAIVMLLISCNLERKTEADNPPGERPVAVEIKEDPPEIIQEYPLITSVDLEELSEDEENIDEDIKKGENIDEAAKTEVVLEDKEEVEPIITEEVKTAENENQDEEEETEEPETVLEGPYEPEEQYQEIEEEPSEEIDPEEPYEEYPKVVEIETENYTFSVEVEEEADDLPADYWEGVAEAIYEEETYEETQEVQEEPEESYDNGMVYLGTYEITAYEWTGNPCANGNYPTEGYTAACNSLPFGTVVYIDGIGYRTIEDRGATWHSETWIDVYMGDEWTCNQFGRQYLDVYIVE